jgi:lysozyme
MVSLAYNIGLGPVVWVPGKNMRKGFRQSKVLQHHIAGDRAKAGAAFMGWVKGGGRVLPGLVARRKAERALYEGRFTEVLEILKARR